MDRWEGRVHIEQLGGWGCHLSRLEILELYAVEASLEHVVFKLPVKHRSGDVLYSYFVNYPGGVHFCVLIPGRSFFL